MVGIESRQVVAVVLVDVFEDDRLTRDKSTPLRRGFIGGGNQVANDADLPAIACDNQQVILFYAVTANFCLGHVEADGADTCRLYQYFLQIWLVEGEAAKGRESGLLAQQLLYGAFCFHARSLLPTTGLASRWKFIGRTRGAASPRALMLLTIFNASRTSFLV